ncbi:MAG TPA: SDR family oxidoreductase [Dehalococcoidia bacterium]|nr:SDR family oxidoreductase [Dehalococcoidia bacterium]
MIGTQDGYALVTGASSGIGYQLAKLFAKNGKNIVVVARSQDRLEELKKEIENEYGTIVSVLAKDLSDPKSAHEIFSELEKKNVNVDVLVNNAGLAVYGKFAATDWDKEAGMIQVNITTLTNLTKLFLNKMLENKSGKILNISSAAGLLPSPCLSVYGATKSYVLNFSEALAHEVRGSGVTVTCFCPGNTKTLFWERANAADCRQVRRQLLFMDTPTVARLAYSALAKNKTTAIASLPLSLAMMFATRLLPRGLAIRMTGIMLGT